MQHRIMQTNFDLGNLARERRRWMTRALAAIVHANVDGRLTDEQYRALEIDLRRADCAAFTPARKVTLIADCKRIVEHYGGQS